MRRPAATRAGTRPDVSPATGPDPTPRTTYAPRLRINTDRLRLPDALPAGPMRAIDAVDVLNLAQRHINMASIERIPTSQMTCQGIRMQLWTAAANGAPVYAEPPNMQHPADWYLCLWGTWARIVPCGTPQMPGDYTGSIDDYRPVPALQPRTLTGHHH